MHYFNQAAGGLMPGRVLQAVTDYMQREQALGSYVAAQQAQPQLQQLYVQLAALLHCQPADIALTTGNTHGWCAVVGALPLQAGDRVLVTPGEWGGNYAMLLQLQARTGCVVETMPCTADGHIDLEALEAGLDARVQLIALTWVPANGSTVYDAQALGQLCARHGIPYIIDAAQALGHIPVDVQALQCDVLTAPGRKWLCGPRGTGLVYLKPGFAARLQPMTVDHVSCPITPTGPVLRQDARMLEQSESSVALKLGLLAALDTAQAEGWAQRFAAIAERARQLRSALADVPGLRLHSLCCRPRRLRHRAVHTAGPHPCPGAAGTAAVPHPGGRQRHGLHPAGHAGPRLERRGARLGQRPHHRCRHPGAGAGLASAVCSTRPLSGCVCWRQHRGGAGLRDRWTSPAGSPYHPVHASNTSRHSGAVGPGRLPRTGAAGLPL